MQKTILCYGDSNTWGFDPDATAASPFPIRHAPDVRWTGVMARELGSGYRVVEEAQNGRTTVHEDPMSPAPRNGRDFLLTCLESQKPIDLVVLMLGTNDTKVIFSVTAQDIALSVGLLAKMIQQSDASPAGNAPKLLIVAPPALGDFSQLPDLGARFAGAQAKSLEMPRHYEAIAKQCGAAFLNAQDYTTPSPVDDIHLDAASHAALGKAIAAKVKTLV